VTLDAAVLAMMHHLQPRANHDKLARITAAALIAEPAIFADDDTRLRSAALVVAVMFRESSFRDVTSATNDFCFLQLHARPDLLGHPAACVHAGITALRASLAGPCHSLAGYVGGGCHNPRTVRLSDDRLALAGELLACVAAQPAAP
jgi:hypothetical protein